MLIATAGLGVVACIAVGIFAFQHSSHRDAEQMLRAKSLVPNRDNTHWEHAHHEAYRGLEQELKQLQSNPADQPRQQQTIKTIQQSQQELANIYQQLRDEEEVRQALATLNANLAPPPGLSELTRELIDRFEAERQQQQEEAERAKADRKKKAEAAKIAAAERKKKAKEKAAKIAAGRAQEESGSKGGSGKDCSSRAQEESGSKGGSGKRLQRPSARQKNKPKQEAPVIQDNPESLLESKGLVKKGSKWILAIEEPLQKRAQTLLTQWKQFNGLGRQLVGVDKKIATNFLLKRHELLEKTRSYHVMRAAVAEDYR